MDFSREETKDIRRRVKARLNESIIQYENKRTALQLDLSPSEIEELSTEDRKNYVIP